MGTPSNIKLKNIVRNGCDDKLSYPYSVTGFDLSTFEGGNSLEVSTAAFSLALGVVGLETAGVFMAVAAGAAGGW